MGAQKLSQHSFLLKVHSSINVNIIKLSSVLEDTFQEVTKICFTSTDGFLLLVSSSSLKGNISAFIAC